MPDYKQLCAELVAWAEKTSAHYYAPPEVLVRARAALAEPEPKRLTVEEISNLHQHRQNYIYEDHRDGEIQLDGYFSRADLQQLAVSIPNTHD
jgi:hypothetical protein